MNKISLLIQINILILLLEIKYKLINSSNNIKFSYYYNLNENSEIIPVLTYHRIVNDWEKKK